MLNNLVLKRNALSSKIVFSVLGTFMCMILPQFFHILGKLSGLGSALGSAFLPMYLPVLFVGLYSGVSVGLVCGLLGPILSYYLTGMPQAAMLPAMTFELAVFGISSGLFAKTSLPTTAKVVLSQLLGRGSRLLFAWVAVSLFNMNGPGISGTMTLFLQGLPGIIFQLVLIPLLLYRLEKIDD